MKNGIKTLAVWIIAGMIFVVLLNAAFNNSNYQMSYSELLNKVTTGEVTTIELSSDSKTAYVTLKGNEFFFHDDASYSDTTRRHVREFMIQYFGSGEFLTKKMIENLMDGKWHKDYGDNES